MSDIEQLAKAQGWKGPEEYSGPPEKFKDAEEFLKVAEEYGPVARERNRRLTEQVEQLNRKIEKTQETLQKLAEHHKKTKDYAYIKAMRDLERQRLEAVEIGDTEKFKEVEKDLLELQSTVAEPAPVPGTDKVIIPDQEVIDIWMKENPWYAGSETDEPDLILAQAATMASNLVAKKKPGLTTAEHLAEVKKMVMKSFPDRFDDPSDGEKTKAPKVMSGNTYGGRSTKSNGKSYSDLPADAKKACDDFVKQGLMSKDEYVKEFFMME